MNSSQISISYISENALLLEWPEKICPEQHQQIIICQQHINTQLKNIVTDSVASYASLMVYYQFDKISLTILDSKLKEIIQNTVDKPLSNTNNLLVKESAKTIEIPVYYGKDAGWDIAAVAQQKALSIEEIIQRHSQQTYRAYALGFTPGFCYLGSLAHSLRLPRKQSPRVLVPKGAVAIAEQQTAVYPNKSPGGWHIIGQTPMEMFKVKNKGSEQQFLPLISVGQQVRFVPIDKNKFQQLGGTIALEKF